MSSWSGAASTARSSTSSTARSSVAEAAGSAVHYPMSAHDSSSFPRVAARARVLDGDRRAAIKEPSSAPESLTYTPKVGASTFWKEDPRNEKSEEYYGMHDGFDRVVFNKSVKKPSASQSFRIDEEGRTEFIPSQLKADIHRADYSSPNHFGVEFTYKGLPPSEPSPRVVVQPVQALRPKTRLPTKPAYDFR